MSLGFMYEQGKDIEPDYTEASNWYRKAADQGDADAQYRLAQLYRKGLGTKQDNNEAYFWELVAEKSDYPDDAYLPDHAYYSAQLTHEIILAVKQRAEEWRAAPSTWEQGKTAFFGKDYQAAFRLLQPLAEEDNQQAQTMLALMYSNGWGIEKDLKEAEKWSAKSMQSLFLLAKQGDTDSQIAICDMYARGTSNIKQDYEEAYFWLRLATSGSTSYGVSKEVHELPEKLTSHQKASVERRLQEWKRSSEGRE